MVIANQPKQPRPSRGREWVTSESGQLRVGDPLAEWGHVTPQFPQGITNSALASADFLVQRQTAIFWFTMNLQPCDLTKGGPYFGFSSGGIGSSSINSGAINVVGFDQGVFAPPAVESSAPLQEEFSGVLSDLAIRAIAEDLPGKWMWIGWPPSQQTQGSTKATLQTALEGLRRQIEALQPAQGGIGNNGPKEAFPLTSDEQTQAVAAIVRLEKLVPDSTEADQNSIEKQTTTIANYARKLGLWLAEGLAKGIAKQAGEDIWATYLQHLPLWHGAMAVLAVIKTFLAELRNPF